MKGPDDSTNARFSPIREESDGKWRTMPTIVTVESLKVGDRFEFVASRSEWADNCFLPHPKGVIVVAKSPFLDTYKQCRFEWRPEKFPKGRSQDWWGVAQTKVRLLGALPPQSAEPATKSVKGKKVLQKK